MKQTTVNRRERMRFRKFITINLGSDSLKTQRQKHGLFPWRETVGLALIYYIYFANLALKILTVFDSRGIHCQRVLSQGYDLLRVPSRQLCYINTNIKENYKLHLQNRYSITLNRK